VMLLRAIKGRSMFLGSKDHFAVRLKLAGWSTKRIVLSAYLAGLCLGIAAICNMFLPTESSIVLYCTISAIFVLLGWRLARIKVT
ncbi:MAG: hypothetical protein ACRD4B_00225, partial [Acidobacteriota bacterium]